MIKNRIYNQEYLKQHKYLQFPEVLLFEKKYSNLSDGAKLAYLILEKCLIHSIKNNWITSNGNLYLCFSDKELTRLFNFSEEKVYRIKKELEQFDLLEQEQKESVTRLYLINPESTNESKEN